MCFYFKVMLVIFACLINESIWSDLLYDKLKWIVQPICSDSSRKNLIYHKSGKAGQLDGRADVMKCAIYCQASNATCFAFQVNLVKTEDVGVGDVFCYHFNDLPDSIYYANLSNDCFLYSAEKVMYVNVSSWGYGDVIDYAPDSNFNNIIGPGQYCQQTTNRGVNLFQVHIQSLQIHNFRTFDVLNRADNVTELLRQYLLNLQAGTVMIGRTCDEGRSNLETIFPSLLSVNLNATDLIYRGKWVFVWQQGAYEKTLSFIHNFNYPLSKQFVFANSARNKSDWMGMRFQTIS